MPARFRPGFSVGRPTALDPFPPPVHTPFMPNREKLAEFVAWSQRHITGDEKGPAQNFLDRLLQGFGRSGCLDVGDATEFRIRKSECEDWAKPVGIEAAHVRS